MGTKLSDCNPALRRRLEAALAGQPSAPLSNQATPQPAVGDRLRQNKKALCNKMEADWWRHLEATLPKSVRVRAQAKKFRLANGVLYQPDFTAVWDGVENAWECKGGRKMKGAMKGAMTVKVAAHEWPEVRFWFVTKDGGQWRMQPVLP